MERENYTVRAAVLTASGAGAPHIRQRLYWVAYSENKRREQQPNIEPASLFRAANEQEKCEPRISTLYPTPLCGMGDSTSKGHTPSEVGRSFSESEKERRLFEPERSDSERRSSTVSGICNTDSDGCKQGSKTATTARHRDTTYTTSWHDCEWLYCRDNKYRPIKSGLIKMASRISRGMVCCCNSSQQNNETDKKGEINYANASKADTRKALSALSSKDGEKAYQWKIRGFGDIQEKEILQSGLHGESLRRSDENGIIQEQSSSIEKGGEEILRGVWKNNHATCSSCGRKSFEQLAIEFDDVVRSMPQGSALAQFFCSEGADYMQALRQTSNEKRSLLDSQYPLSEIWESIDDQEKNRVRIHFNNRGWLLIETLKPLVDGVPKGMVRGGDSSTSIDADNTQEARVMRLKGYGNAIVPQVAADFIKRQLRSNNA